MRGKIVFKVKAQGRVVGKIVAYPDPLFTRCKEAGKNSDPPLGEPAPAPSRFRLTFQAAD